MGLAKSALTTRGFSRLTIFAAYKGSYTPIETTPRSFSSLSLRRPSPEIRNSPLVTLHDADEFFDGPYQVVHALFIGPSIPA